MQLLIDDYSLSSMRNRTNRIKSTVPLRNSKNQEHFLIWLNSEYSAQSSNDINIVKFGSLQQAWSKGFLKHILQNISSQYFSEQICSSFKLTQQQQYLCQQSDSSRSLNQHKNYEKTLQQIQNYLRSQIGKSLSKNYMPYFINLQKLAALILFVCITSKMKQHTAKIILNLPAQTQQHLHKQIKNIQSNLQTIKQYQQLLKALEQLQLQNNNLNTEIIEMTNIIQQQKQQIKIKNQDIQKMKLQCQKIQWKFIQLTDKMSLSNIEDIGEVYENMVKNCDSEIRYSNTLLQQKTDLQQQNQKLQKSILERDKIIIQLTQKLDAISSSAFNPHITYKDTQQIVYLPTNSIMFTEKQKINSNQPQLKPSNSFSQMKQLSKISTKISENSKIQQYSFHSSYQSFYKPTKGLSYSESSCSKNNQSMNYSNQQFFKETKIMINSQGKQNYYDNSSLLNGKQTLKQYPNNLMNRTGQYYSSKNANNMKIDGIINERQILFTQTIKNKGIINQDQCAVLRQKIKQLLLYILSLQEQISKYEVKMSRHYKKIQKATDLHHKFCQVMNINSYIEEHMDDSVSI